MKPSLYPLQPIMIIDDEQSTLNSFRLALRTGGINHIILCQDSRQVLPMLEKEAVSVVLLDLGLPHCSGEEILQWIANEHPELPVIIITGDNQVETAVNCMKNGAFDYIVKPVEKTRLLSSVRRALEIQTLQQLNQSLKERMLSQVLNRPEAFSEIITSNRAMLTLFQYAESIAVSPQPVLITGETGVGKELMAKAVHKLSRRPGDFISVNAAGIDDEVFADTLFGHVKGAFTGADQARKGLIESAFGGTLVLDEIGDLGMASQIKLLRLIQEREFYPVGSDVPKIADARIIANTNHDLKALQSEGRFRKDLYFRFQMHHIHIPPLRARLDDIPLLLDHFLEEAAKALGKEPPAYPDELVTLLKNYHFPGNIRELRTMIYDALSTHESRIISMKRFQLRIDQERSEVLQPASAPQSHDRQEVPLQFSGTLPTLKEANRVLIKEAIKRTDNNQSMAARLLGISRQTLARHLSTE